MTGPTAPAGYRVKRWLGFGGPAVSPAPKGPALFEAVRETISRHVQFSEEWALDLAALWVLQAYIAESLPSVFFVFFSASKGKAKTTALDLLCVLTDGLNASDISAPALVHWLEEHPNGAVCIDEMDVKRDAERDSAVAAICRSGYTPGKPYLRWDPKTRKLDECPTYGAKALGFRAKVDDALEDRGFTLPTATVKGRAGAKLVQQNFARDVGDLPSRLRAWAKSTRATPASVRLDAILRGEMAAEAWLETVEAVVGAENLGANRETQLTSVALAVCRAACIDLTESLQAAFGLRREVAAANTDEDLEEARDLLETMLREIGTLTKEAEVCVVRQSAFAARLGALRKERGQLRRLTSVQIAALRNDLGIKPTWLTHPGNKVTWNIPASERESLFGQGVANLPNLANSTVKDEKVSQVSHVRHPSPERDLSEPGADPGDLFRGQPTKGDRARAHFGEPEREGGE